MITISAINSKGVKVAGIADDLRLAAKAALSSLGRAASVERCEADDLADCISTFAWLYLIGALPDEARAETQFWRVACLPSKG
jgi:hypothetical protein